MGTFKESIERIKTQIRESRSILLLLHSMPDPDSVGSNLAVYNYLKVKRKRVRIGYLEDPPLPNLRFLKGFGSITKLGLDSVLDGSSDLLLALDVSNLSRLGLSTGVLSHLDVMVINIDHHPTNTMFGDINLVEPSASSTAEILARYVLGNSLNADIARSLLAGILGDTGGLSYSLSDVTLEVVARLFRFLGTRLWRDTIFNLQAFTDFPLFQLYAKIIIEYSYVAQGFLVVELPYSFLAKVSTIGRRGILLSHIKKLGNYLQGVKGQITILELKPKFFYISFKNSPLYPMDVSLLAQAFGGGGHANAAGAYLKADNIEQVREEIRVVLRASLQKNKS